MKTIPQETTATFREKGSKFIGFLFPVESVEKFEERLDRLKAEYHDASHHCYGWRIHPNKIEEFAQDDGEPGGTAGLPILNQLKSYDALNCACVVIRYFGGTKLGKSGLIQAYGHTAKLCFQKASLSTLIPTENFKITYPYQEQSHINRLKNSFDLKELSSEYLEKVTLKIACRSEQAPAFARELEKLEHLGVDSTKLGKGFIVLNT
ncbi:MAG TPA: YigZ family protein [Balneolaceae bacterium]|nr:YigZ family protein [Balneolaceae bacterium]